MHFGQFYTFHQPLTQRIIAACSENDTNYVPNLEQVYFRNEFQE